MLEVIVDKSPVISIAALMSSLHLYIRFIYHLVILENAVMRRTAAVWPLVHFGVTCEDLLPNTNIFVQLQSSLVDTENDVHDRDTYFYSIFSPEQATLNSQYI